MTDKKMVPEIFKKLRKNGFTARQNFLCCQTCGWAAIEDVAKGNESIVFYHHQDNDSFTKDGMLEDTLYLAWSGDGHKIKEIIESYDYKVDWDGTEDKRIGILPK